MFQNISAFVLLFACIRNFYKFFHNTTFFSCGLSAPFPLCPISACTNKCSSPDFCTVAGIWVPSSTVTCQIDTCSVNNGGCEGNLTCALASNNTNTCICDDGYFSLNNNECVANSCYNNNGGCGAHSACTPIGPNQNNCSCVSGFTSDSGNGTDCTATSNSKTSSTSATAYIFTGLSAAIGLLLVIAIIIAMVRSNNHHRVHQQQQPRQEIIVNDQYEMQPVNHCDEADLPPAYEAPRLFRTSALPAHVIYLPPPDAPPVYMETAIIPTEPPPSYSPVETE